MIQTVFQQTTGSEALITVNTSSILTNQIWKKTYLIITNSVPFLMG